MKNRFREWLENLVVLRAIRAFKNEFRKKEETPNPGSIKSGMTIIQEWERDGKITAERAKELKWEEILDWYNCDRCWHDEEDPEGPEETGPGMEGS
jgi:hypothetical protein